MGKDLKEIILETLDQEDPNIVRAACVMSGQLGLEEAQRGLVKQLAHKAWQVQAEAAKALGKLGPAAAGAVPYLRRIIKASESDLRQKVLANAALTPRSTPPDGDETHPEVLRSAAVALAHIEPKVAQEALLAALASDNTSLLEAAMAGLANLEATQGRERMVELLSHADASVRRVAAAAAGKLRERSALAGLLRLLGDDDANVRKEAVIALNHIKDSQAIGPLTSVMEDADPGVRRTAAIALGNTKRRDPELVACLVKALADNNAEVRQAALSALANLKAASALEQAAQLMGDTHEAVSKQAAIAVTALATAKERPDYDPA